MTLHPAPTGTFSAKCQRAPGAHLRNRSQVSIYWTQNGWGYPPTLSHIRKSPLWLDFIVDEVVKSFLPHLQDFSVPAVPNSWEKPGFLACLESLMHRHTLDWERGSQGFSCSWQQEDRSGQPTKASSLGWCKKPTRRVLSSLLLGEVLWQSSSMAENTECFCGRR